MATIHKTKNYIKNGQRVNVSTNLGGASISTGTVTVVYSIGQGLIGGGLAGERIRVFVTSAANVPGTFLFELDPSTHNLASGSPASVGSGSSEGTDLFTAGKGNNHAAVVTLNTAQLAAVNAAIVDPNAVFVFDPMANFDACVHFKVVYT